MDEIDKKIISQLQADGRTTLKDLSKITGFTSMGTKKRLDKLINKGTLKVSALINPRALQLHPAIVMLEMESSKAMKKLLERFKDCPRVIQIFKTIGGYNLIALIMAENQATLESEAMERCSLRSGEGVRRSEFYPIGKVHHSSFLPLRQNLPREENEITPCGVDCRSCPSFQDQQCLGCPSASYYKGPLR